MGGCDSEWHTSLAARQQSFGREVDVSLPEIEQSLLLHVFGAVVLLARCSSNVKKSSSTASVRKVVLSN
jgi:hypothetical protein